MNSQPSRAPRLRKHGEASCGLALALVPSRRVQFSSSPNTPLQRTRRPSRRSGRSLRSLGSPLSGNPLGDLAHRGAECGERSPSPGHRNWQSLANLAAWWSWLSSHGGVGRVASSWQIGWRSSGTVAQSAARPSSGGAHSSPNTSLQRTRRPRFRAGRSLRSLGSPLSSNPLAARGKSLFLSA